MPTQREIRQTAVELINCSNIAPPLIVEALIDCLDNEELRKYGTLMESTAWERTRREV